MASGMESCKHWNQAPEVHPARDSREPGWHGAPRMRHFYEAGVKDGIARAEAAVKRKPASE